MNFSRFSGGIETFQMLSVILRILGFNPAPQVGNHIYIYIYTHI